MQPLVRIALTFFCCLGLLWPRLLAEDLALPELIARVEPGVVRIEVHTNDGEATGSGFIVDGGWIVTNYHVVDDAKSAEVVFADRSKAKVVGIRAFAPEKDLAVVEIENSKGRPSLQLADSLPRKGESVVAFGAPMGFAFTPSQGIVSGIRKGAEIKEVLEEYDSSVDMTWIQTTAAISKGNSGGPLVDAQCRVIGVNSWTLKTAQNLSFSVSAPDLAVLLNGVGEKPLVVLGDQPPSDAPAFESPAPKAQFIYDLYAITKFESLEEYVRKKFQSAAEQLQNELRSVAATDDTIKIAQSRFDFEIEMVRKLADFDPGLPRFLREDKAVIGRPGTWYVLQVVGPTSMLVSPDRRSDEIIYVADISTAGKVDRMSYDFDGVWFTTGETHTYETVGGGSRTVYVARRFPLEISKCLAQFRKSHVAPAIDKLIASNEKPAAPVGEELEALERDRQEYREKLAKEKQLEIDRRKKEKQLEMDRRTQEVWAEQERAKQIERKKYEEELARLEKQAVSRLKLAKQRLVNSPEMANKLLYRILNESPNSSAAVEAEEILFGTNKNRFREWRSGKFSTLAVLLGQAKNGNVILKQASGKVIEILIDRLSTPDQEYVKNELLRRSKEQ